MTEFGYIDDALAENDAWWRDAGHAPDYDQPDPFTPGGSDVPPLPSGEPRPYQLHLERADNDGLGTITQGGLPEWPRVRCEIRPIPGLTDAQIAPAAAEPPLRGLSIGFDWRPTIASWQASADPRLSTAPTPRERAVTAEQLRHAFDIPAGDPIVFDPMLDRWEHIVRAEFDAMMRAADAIAEVFNELFKPGAGGRNTRSPRLRRDTAGRARPKRPAPSHAPAVGGDHTGTATPQHRTSTHTPPRPAPHPITTPITANNRGNKNRQERNPKMNPFTYPDNEHHAADHITDPTGQHATEPDSTPPYAYPAWPVGSVMRAGELRDRIEQGRHSSAGIRDNRPPERWTSPVMRDTIRQQRRNTRAAYLGVLLILAAAALVALMLL